MLVKQIIMCNQFIFSISFYNRKINQINRFAIYFILILSIERDSQTNVTSNGCSFLQLDAVTNRKIAWLLIVIAGIPVTTTGRSIHSKWAGCSFSLLGLIVFCRKRETFAEWVDEKKSYEAMISFLLCSLPCSPMANPALIIWLSAISEQQS